MPKKAEPEKMSFKNALTRLEEIVESIESGGTELEASLKLYKEGVELAKFCGNSLNDIEKEVLILQKSAEGVFTLGKELEQY